ncbi:hypothetical protein NP493_11g11042 [Ridgeia piscesae]|uniref:Uncharacterized protein n=1 Tax=Ridgeia piscesae TaxID=27915 RepID=A0AAD9PFH8_RIDPI|nr:hypothetical protein NP493_11g11042 [Ridgeia piscesae]
MLENSLPHIVHGHLFSSGSRVLFSAFWLFSFSLSLSLYADASSFGSSFSFFFGHFFWKYSLNCITHSNPMFCSRLRCTWGLKRGMLRSVLLPLLLLAACDI